LPRASISRGRPYRNAILPSSCCSLRENVGPRGGRRASSVHPPNESMHTCERCFSTSTVARGRRHAASDRRSHRLLVHTSERWSMSLACQARRRDHQARSHGVFRRGRRPPGGRGRLDGRRAKWLVLMRARPALRPGAKDERIPIGDFSNRTADTHRTAPILFSDVHRRARLFVCYFCVLQPSIFRDDNETPSWTISRAKTAIQIRREGQRAGGSYRGTTYVTRSPRLTIQTVTFCRAQLRITRPSIKILSGLSWTRPLCYRFAAAPSGAHLFGVPVDEIEIAALLHITKRACGYCASESTWMIQTTGRL